MMISILILLALVSTGLLFSMSQFAPADWKLSKMAKWRTITVCIVMTGLLFAALMKLLLVSQAVIVFLLLISLALPLPVFIHRHPTIGAGLLLLLCIFASFSWLHSGW